MTDSDIDVKYMYGWNYYMLRFMGIWPEERKWYRAYSYLVLLPCIMMLCFVCAPQTVNLSLIAGDSDLVIENLSTNITITLSLMKTIVIWFKGESLRPLIKSIVNDWDTVTNETERETMVNIAIITRKTTMRSTLMVNIVVLAFLPARLSNMRYSDSALFFRGYFPYNTSISPNFELTIIGQFIATVYAANTYTAIDTFVVLLIFHVCGQLSNLRDDLRKIHSYDKKNVETKLQKIIRKHEYINRFATTIENSFNMMLLLQMLGCTIQICSQSYQVIMSFEEEAMEYMIFQITFLLLYVVYVMLQLFLYCYMGEKLAAESTEIANTAFYVEWYNLPPKSARWLVIIMCRARSSPLQITAGRFCWFTLALYSQIENLFMADLKNVYTWNYNLLKFMGIWPEERKWNRSSSYLVLLPCIIMLCFACIPQTINLPMIAGDSDLVVENLSINITVMVSLMKTLTVWINGIPLKSLLRYIANDWDAVTNNTERETMVNIARITRKITIGSTLMVNIVILAFVPARLSSMKNTDITLFLRGYYPYNTSISPNLELTMITQYVAAIYAANTYTTVDTLVVLLIFHVCGQLSILRQDLGKIHSYDKKNIEIKMQKIVEKHEYINRFAGRIENSFNMMLLFQMLSCTIQICSQFYQVITSLGENTMEHIILQISFLLIYVTYVMLQLFLYCYMGEKLAAESTEIANTAYNTKWYNLPPKNARWLLFIMCRAASSPLQITAGRFCSFNFVLYCQVLKTSMGYVSVLYAMKNK